MRIFREDITLIEVPGEVSLTLAVSGCPNNCPGCSWANSDTDGYKMSVVQMKEKLKEVVGSVTVVTFLGGEWDSAFMEYLVAVKEMGFKTCLYTGNNDPDKFGYMLDYLKTGEYKEELGGLDSETTNQRFTNVTTGKSMNHLFVK